MGNLLRAMAALVILLACAIAASAQVRTAFYVVLGTFDMEGGEATFAGAERQKAAAARCGVEGWSEYTSKIQGFKPGYFAVLAGPYRTRTAADAVRSRVLRCVPDAYVKAGGEPGE